MKLKTLALSAASLMLVLSFLACNLPGGDGAPAFMMNETSAPVEDSPTPDPRIPTNTDGAETILIPGGTFWMGSEDGDALAEADEQPRHEVTLGTFPIYTHEVTNAMYARCVEAGACIPVRVLESGPTSHYEDPAFAEHPVVGVDWNMADDYCTWAGARLPTEAEWEYAARGPDSLTYPWGSEDPACDRVNMLGCLVPPDTEEVGSFERGNSPFAVWDLSGNVWEWVNDWYDPDYYALSPSNSPVGPNLPEDRDNPQKVVRGGGLQSEPPAMRSAARVGARLLRPFDDVGFRCVAQPALDLPAGYTDAPEGHEWVPPDPLDGGGEIVEAPDDDAPWWSIGWATASCPDPEGRMHLFVEADSSEAVEYEVDVNGNPFDCYYDEALRGLQCEGPIPEDNEDLDFYTVMVLFSELGFSVASVDRPTDCPAGRTGLLITATASCPDEGGFVTITFTYRPSIEWTRAQVEDGGGFADMRCWETSGNSMNCLVPAGAPGDTYVFSLGGVDAEGNSRSSGLTARVPEGCPVDFYDEGLSTLCHENHPVVQVSYVPASRVLASVSSFGVPLACIGMAPGVQICGDLPGDPGSPSMVTTCFEGEDCTDWPVTVPACPGAEPEFGFEILSTCYATLGPVVVISYSPADVPLVAANANGFDLTCVDSSTPGHYMCYTLPGSPGSEMTITFCLEEGACHSRDITVSTCEQEETTDYAFRLAGIGCHDESQIFFSVETGDGAVHIAAPMFTQAQDGDTEYTCGPTEVVGRLYCFGARPGSPGPLEVCYGFAPSDTFAACHTFDSWPTEVATIPDCAAEEPPPAGDACSVWTDLNSCTSNPPCRWNGSSCYTP